MIPAVSTFRMRSFWESEMKRLPVRSTATAIGLWSLAETAGPPSPPNPHVVPATVVIRPDGSIRRTRCSAASAVYRFPFPSLARPRALPTCAFTAGPPSPPWLTVPLPAAVVMTPPLTLRSRR